MRERRHASDAEAADLLDEVRDALRVARGTRAGADQEMRVEAVERGERALDVRRVGVEILGRKRAELHGNARGAELARGKAEPFDALARGDAVHRAEVERGLVDEHQDRAARAVGAVAQGLEILGAHALEERGVDVEALESEFLGHEVRDVHRQKRRLGALDMLEGPGGDGEEHGVGSGFRAADRSLHPWLSFPPPRTAECAAPTKHARTHEPLNHEPQQEIHDVQPRQLPIQRDARMVPPGR